MARRTKEEAEKTRTAILNAAEKVFYKQGVARTSLEQIAAKAAVTRGAVYWHFKNKAEVCEAMCDRVFLPQEDVLEKITAHKNSKPLEELEEACRDALQRIANDKQRHRVVSILMFRCEYVEEMAGLMERRRECKDRMLVQFRAMFERAHKLKMLAKGWTPDLAATSLQAMMGGLILHGLEGRKNFSLAKTAADCLKSFFAALRA